MQNWRDCEGVEELSYWSVCMVQVGGALKIDIPLHCGIYKEEKILLAGKQLSLREDEQEKREVLTREKVCRK